jgi:hypothetical protein
MKIVKMTVLFLSALLCFAPLAMADALAVDGVCTWDPNTWIMTAADFTTGGVSPVQVVVRWGDTSGPTIITPGAVVSHTYLAATQIGPLTVTQRAIDADLNTVIRNCEVQANPIPFKVTGKVVGPNGPVQYASVRLKKGLWQAGMYTGADGLFSFGKLTPGVYTLVVTRSGLTFQTRAITVGPDSLNLEIKNAT